MISILCFLGHSLFCRSKWISVSEITMFTTIVSFWSDQDKSITCKNNQIMYCKYTFEDQTLLLILLKLSLWQQSPKFRRQDTFSAILTNQMYHNGKAQSQNLHELPQYFKNIRSVLESAQDHQDPCYELLHWNEGTICLGTVQQY